MKTYLLPLFLIALIAAGCNKKRCYLCSWAGGSKVKGERFAKEYCGYKVSEISKLEQDLRNVGYEDARCEFKAEK